MKSDKKTKPGPGDLVEISLIKTTYKGVLLDSPEDEKGIILLKLDSGYNIGLKKKDIFDIKVLKKAEKKEDETEVKKTGKSRTLRL